MSADPTTRHVVGVMTGTSIDGIDAALVRIDGSGLTMRPELSKQYAGDLGDLQAGLRRAAEQVSMTAGEFASLAWRFGELHADCIGRLLDGQPAPDLIVAHGQTIYHKPPASWQLLNPAPIAAAFDCPVICDLRQPDLAAGGEGAPITPLADWILFRSTDRARTVVNLGGFVNVTMLPRDADGSTIDDIRAFDVCACNHILNAIATRCFDEPFDRNGAHAGAGTPHEHAAAAMFQTAADRSLGTGDEFTSWVDDQLGSMSGNDVAATAVRGIALQIHRSLIETGAPIDEILVAGGGACNRALVRAIESTTGLPVSTTNSLGVPIQMREAMAMAVLGALCTDGIDTTLSQVTGRR